MCVRNAKDSDVVPLRGTETVIVFPPSCEPLRGSCMGLITLRLSEAFDLFEVVTGLFNSLVLLSKNKTNRHRKTYRHNFCPYVIMLIKRQKNRRKT